LATKLLEVRDLQTHFKTREGVVRAVNGVSFDLEPGERIGIVGESGCGKSVTALSIMRLVKSPPGQIAGGNVLFEGRDLLDLSEGEMRRVRGGKIGMIFQDPMTSLNPTMTIGQQLAEGIQLHLKLKKGAALERAAELLRQVGIPDAGQRLKAYPHQFSGGMRQRVMIAMALACNPKLLIADEPTTALDVTVQAQILELIRSVCQEFGSAVMLITHDMGVVAGMTDRIVVMYAGHVIESAPTDELFANPRHPYTLGLLSCIPRLDERRQETLTPIEGAPPDLLNPPVGCPFAPRCGFVMDVCRKFPPLRPVGPNHVAACWADTTSPAEQERAQARRLAMAAARGDLPLTTMRAKPTVQRPSDTQPPGGAAP
jgi:oligopeptide transport system ATP-binding protein